MERLPIANPFPGAAAFLVASTASTQEDAKRLAAELWPPGSLVAAEEQSAGRGRFPERAWTSEPGRNLLVSLYLGKPRRALPIRVGLALCEAAEAYAAGIGAALPSPPELKWPNDLMLNGRKAAGILCETSAFGPAGPRVFAGVGLNCNQVRFPEALRGKATSLALELGREVDRWAILELFLARLAEDLGTGLSASAASGTAAGESAAADDPECLEKCWRRSANRRLWRRGEVVSFLPGLAGRAGDGPAVVGTLEGIDAEGSILIRSLGAAEPCAFPAGELSVGPSRPSELTVGPSRPVS